MLPRRNLKLAFIAVAAFGPAACADTDDGSGAAASATRDDDRGSIVVPLRNYQRNSGGGRGLALDVAIGGAAAKPLVVDTGSAGIHVLARDVEGASVVRTGKAISETYFDGTMLVGEEARAIVKIGSAATPRAIAVHLVDEIRCADFAPDCGGKPTEADPKGLTFFHDSGMSGIVGIGMSNAFAEPSVYSPLAQLPGNLATGYVVQTSGYEAEDAQLTIGLTDAIRATFDVQQLERQSHALPNGVAAWEDARAQGCYTLEGSTLQSECTATIFDTGATAFFWNTTKLYTNEVYRNGELKEGLTVVAHFPGINRDWRITVGANAKPGVDMIINSPGVRNTNLGIGVYFAYDVMHDVKKGTIGLRERRR